MSFTRRNLHKNTGLNMLKWATLFFFWMSCVMFMARAFEIVPSAPNVIQYIQQIFLTKNWDNKSDLGIILDWRSTGGITIMNLTSAIVLGTDSSGKIIRSTSGSIYNFISWFALSGPNWATGATWPQWATWAKWDTWAAGTNGIAWATWAVWATWHDWVDWVTGANWVTGDTWPQWATWAKWNTWIAGTNGINWATWAVWATWHDWVDWVTGAMWPTGNSQDKYLTGMYFNSGNNILSLYVSWANTVTGYFIFSGMANRYSAYSWAQTSWNTLRGWYLATGININSLAIATLNCTTGQIVGRTGGQRECLDMSWIQWPVWPKWTTGDQWEIWLTWPKWATGDQWEIWLTWPKWATGDQWEIWLTWPKWATGDQWQTWLTGPQWANGINGVTWTKWDTWFLQAWITGATPYWNNGAWVTTGTNIFNTWWNVGIGTIVPTAKLHLFGTFIAWGITNIINGSAYGFIGWWTWNSLYNANYSAIIWWSNNSISGASNSLALWNNSQVIHNNTFVRNSDTASFTSAKIETFIINADGWVGIFTNNPATGTLHIWWTGTVVFSPQAFKGSGCDLTWAVYYNNDLGHLCFCNGSGNWMRVDSKFTNCNDNSRL